MDPKQSIAAYKKLREQLSHFTHKVTVFEDIVHLRMRTKIVVYHDKEIVAQDFIDETLEDFSLLDNSTMALRMHHKVTDMINNAHKFIYIDDL